MSVSALISLLQSAIIFGTVIMFGCLGEILTEKSGNLNLGVPGIMYIGGIASLVCVFFYENSVEAPSPVLCVLIAFFSGFAAAALAGLLFSFLTVTLRANQNVTGLTLTIFGSGVANFFGGSLNKLAGGVGQISTSVTSSAFRTPMPGLSSVGFAHIGELFSSFGFMVYFAIICAIILNFVIKRTRVGLNLRAVGENPSTADAAGINVTAYKYAATCLGAGKRRLHRKARLARRCARYFHHMESAERNLGCVPLRSFVLDVLLHFKSHPFLSGAVQDASLHRNDRRAYYHEPSQEKGKSASGGARSSVFPRRKIISGKLKAAAVFTAAASLCSALIRRRRRL